MNKQVINHNKLSGKLQHISKDISTSNHSICKATAGNAAWLTMQQTRFTG